MDNEKLMRLKELAEKATPGPWVWVEPIGETMCVIHQQDKSDTYPLGEIARTLFGETQDNAAYIAAISPDVLLALINEIERLQNTVDFQIRAMGEYRNVAKMAWGGEIPSPLPGHESSEEKMVEMFEHLNCPYCGGSGHIDDCDEAARKVGKNIERLEKEADWLADYIGRHECRKGEPETSICPSRKACANCWREAARKAVEQDNANNHSLKN